MRQAETDKASLVLLFTEKQTNNHSHCFIFFKIICKEYAYFIVFLNFHEVKSQLIEKYEYKNDSSRNKSDSKRKW